MCPADTSPREKGVSHYGIQDSQPLGKGVTITTVPVLLAPVLPLLCPAWGSLVIHVHSWHVHRTEHSFEEKESLFQLLKSNCGIAFMLQKVAEWVPALSDFESGMVVSLVSLLPEPCCCSSRGGSHRALELQPSSSQAFAGTQHWALTQAGPPVKEALSSSFPTLSQLLDYLS